MEKVKMPVESLDVDTFETGEAQKTEGTVHAHMTPAGGVCCTVGSTGCQTVEATHPCTSC